MSRDVAPLDPVRDAAHAGAEVPAIADEGDAEIEGQADALRRRVPLERKGRLGRVGRNETSRVGLQLQLRIELVEAKTVQVMVVRHDIHAIAAGISAVLCEEREARAIRSGDIEGKLVGLPSADAKARRSNVPVARAVQQLLELSYRNPHTPARRDTDPRRRKSPESSGRPRAA